MGLSWEDVRLSKQYKEIKCAVAYPKKNQLVIKGTKTRRQIRILHEITRKEGVMKHLAALDARSA